MNLFGLGPELLWVPLPEGPLHVEVVVGAPPFKARFRTATMARKEGYELVRRLWGVGAGALGDGGAVPPRAGADGLAGLFGLFPEALAGRFAAVITALFEILKGLFRLLDVFPEGVDEAFASPYRFWVSGSSVMPRSARAPAYMFCCRKRVVSGP